MTDPVREIPSDEEFGQRVREAREKRDWKQGHLAARVGCTQPVISAIEAGKASQFIPEVCRVLKIPGPMWGWSEEQKLWAILGHKLEAYSKASFKFSLNNIKAMIEEMEKKSPPPDDDAPPPSPRVKSKGPLRAMKSVSVTTGTRPVQPRNTDEPQPPRKK